jgi:hypothetical protein
MYIYIDIYKKTPTLPSNQHILPPFPKICIPDSDNDNSPSLNWSTLNFAGTVQMASIPLFGDQVQAQVKCDEVEKQCKAGGTPPAAGGAPPAEGGSTP